MKQKNRIRAVLSVLLILVSLAGLAVPAVMSLCADQPYSPVISMLTTVAAFINFVAYLYFFNMVSERIHPTAGKLLLASVTAALFAGETVLQSALNGFARSHRADSGYIMYGTSLVRDFLYTVKRELPYDMVKASLCFLLMAGFCVIYLLILELEKNDCDPDSEGVASYIKRKMQETDETEDGDDTSEDDSDGTDNE